MVEISIANIYCFLKIDTFVQNILIMKYRAVIFDMDGVLIDSEPLHIELETKMITELNIPLNKEMYSRFAGTTSLSMWKILVEEFNLDKNPKMLSLESDKRFIEALLTTDKVKLFDGVKVVLNKLKELGIPLALASSSSIDVVNAVLRKFELEGVFSAVVTGSDVQNSKPHPEIFLKASQMLNISPSYCVVVEDSPNGIKAAKLARINCIGFASPSNKHVITDATYIMKSFREFDYQLV